jgi:stage III sporulation protein AD
MDVVRLVGFGMAAALLALSIRGQRPEMAVLLSLAAGLAIFAALAGRLEGIVRVLSGMAETAALPSGVLWLILRVVGISYLTEFGAQMCRDAGEGGIASKVELGGRILVLALSVPVLLALMQMMMEFIP